MISSCLDGLSHPIQAATPQKITPDYAAPAATPSALASTFTSGSA
jgi:hypothetical protein